MKRRSHTRYPSIFLLAISSVFSQMVVAEIYKWLDTEGKIHYGDKPIDPVQAGNAQQVELRESYKPAVRTTQEQRAHEEEQRLIRLRDDVRRREEQQALEETRAQQREDKRALCANYGAAIRKLSTVHEINGVPAFAYLKDEYGKSVSVQRQLEIIEELKAKSKDADCT